MDQTLLCISWLNGQFKAMSVHKGVVSRKWEASQPADDLGSFPALLNEAVEQTGYNGTNVALALMHPRLTHQLVETPPAKGWLLERYLSRRIAQLKTFEGEAVWSYEPTPATKGAKVRMMGMKRDSATAMPPWRWKNSSVRRRYSTLSSRYRPLKAGGPIARPIE